MVVPRGKALVTFIYPSSNMVDPAREIGLAEPASFVRMGGRRADGFPRIVYSILESCLTASNPLIFSIRSRTAKKQGSGYCHSFAFREY